jgi:RHS repeat-associated protein
MNTTATGRKVAKSQRGDSAVATATPIARYVHPDNLGSTAVTSDASGNLAQWLDYAPYGSVLASENTGTTTAARQYIGQFSDASGLSYLNARYYNPTQWQFLSQDPIFLLLGNQLQQLSRQDQQTVLQNPQQLNSYSYAQDNPITGEDPSGKYGEISGTVVIPGRSFSAGIRFDENGADYFLGYGVGSGAEAGVEYAWAPGEDIPLESQATVSINAEYADGLGGRLSQDILTYGPNQKKLIPNAGPSGAMVVGAGEAADVETEVTAPIPGLAWGTPSNGEVQPYTGPTYLSAYHPSSQTQASYSSQGGGSSGGGGGSGLGQILSNLYSTLVQLSAALSSYASGKSSH